MFDCVLCTATPATLPPTWRSHLGNPRQLLDVIGEGAGLLFLIGNHFI